MVTFLGLSAVLWGLGAALGAPRSARWLMILLLYIAVLVALVLLPPDSPLAAVFGGSKGEWVALGVIGLAVWGYSKGLGALRARVRPENRPAEAAGSGPAEGDGIERYARHIVLREIGGQGQKRLREARVLVVGAGGLGSPALLYLGAAGVGTIGIIDHDVVDRSNLQRQVIHTDAGIGMPKVFSAQQAIAALNPLVTVRPYNRALTGEIAQELFSEYDIVLDGTDGVEVRYAINRAAFAAGRPLVSGAISQWEGQLSTFAPQDGTPCYRCVFPEPNAPGVAPTCAEGGVLGPLPGVIGAMMAVEAIKEITGAGEGLRGRLAIYDALYGETRTIALRRRPDCPVCGG